MRLVPCLVVALIASFHSISYGDDPCPAGMRLIDGEYCPNADAPCLDWMDPPDAAARRCTQYGPSKCLGPTHHKRYCIEQTEHLEPSTRLPVVGINAYQAEAMCKALGWRMCSESEHQMACQGWDLRPYPQGWTRQCGEGQCNCDINTDIGPVGHRTDKRKTPEQTAGCVSQWGVQNLVGSVDEWWKKDQSVSKYDYVLRSGHWLSVRDRCWASTTAHSSLYSDSTVGFRCCADPTQ